MDKAKGSRCNSVLRIGLRVLLSRGARVKANVGVGCERKTTGRTQDRHYSTLEDTNKDRTTHVTEMDHQRI